MKLPLKRVVKPVKQFFSFLWRNFSFSKQSGKWATWGLFVSSILLAVAFGIFMPVGLHPWADPFIGIVFFAVILFLSGAGFLLALRLLNLIPRFYKDWGILLMGGLAVLFVMLFEPKMGIPFAILFVIIESLFFVGLFSLITGSLKGSPLLKRIWILSGLVVGLFINVYIVYWLQKDGSGEYLIDMEKVKHQEVKALDLENPAQKGTYEVKTLFYGSQNFRNRPEFSEDVDIVTYTVDGSEFLTGNDGFKIKIRNFLLGFDQEHLPLNGQVWYPKGNGLFPLVLIVHGNHSMAEYSDPGYAYLGEHLASKGYIAVSVDENFLNGSFVGGLKKENDARAWMMLQHLKLWHQWNRTDTSMFYQHVDTSRIALIGHSRGGEAVAIAGNFNRLPYYPDNANVRLDFNYSIRSIIAIAPSYGQYDPAGKPNHLKNVNYFVIQGAHDADVSSFMGMRQFHNTSFTRDSLFKASLYIYRSNHGQFNSVWGNTDFGWPLSLFLNKKPLLQEEKQQQIAKVYFTGFLETTIRNKYDYLPMFKDYRYAMHWLPEDVYINRYEDTQKKVLCTYEEDVDVTTGSVEGVELGARHFKLWKEYDLSFRNWGTKHNNALTLGWKRDTTETKDSIELVSFNDSLPVYRVEFSESLDILDGVDGSAFLVFSAANTEETLPDDEEETEEAADSLKKNQGNTLEKEKQDEKEKEAVDKNTETEEDTVKQVDFSIRLTDQDGNSSQLPLSHFAYIPPVLKAEFLKLESQNKRYGSDYEVTLQDFRLPLKAFMEANEQLDPESIRIIEFVFDKTREGVIVIDDIGFEGESF